MSDFLFLDREGNPIPGQAPVSFSVQGDPISGAALNLTQQTFYKFAEAASLSLATSLRQEVRIDGETLAIFEVNHGVFKVHAIVDRPKRDSEFFGGIVLQLETIDPAWLDDVHYNYVGDWLSRPRGEATYPTDAERTLIPDSVLVNDVAAIVPGPLGGDFEETETDTLIFQIARNGNLASDPVATGLVKIFRIRSPRVGSIASHDFEEGAKYIVSADFELEAGSPFRTRANGFYLCGQLLPIPPTPWQAANYDHDKVRLYTLGLDPTSFATAAETRGIVVLAWWGALWVYDMGLPIPAWEQIAAVSTDSPFAGGELAAYGYDFVKTVTVSSTTLRCQGNDSGGVLSAFEITMIQQPEGGHSFSGVVFLAFRPDITSTDPQTRDFMQSVTWESDVTDIGPSTPDGYRLMVPVIMARDSSVSAQYLVPSAGPTKDIFVGGALNPGSFRLLAYSSSEHVTSGSYSASINMSIQAPRVGAVGFSFSTSDYFATSLPTLTESGAITTNHSVRFEYLAVDRHRKNRAWRLDKTRGGQWFSAPVLQAPFQPSGSNIVQMGAAHYRIDLIDRSKQSAFSRPDFLSLFGGAVAGAPSFDTTMNGHTYVTTDYPTWHYFVDPPNSGIIVNTSETFIQSFFTGLKDYDKSLPLGPFPVPTSAAATTRFSGSASVTVDSATTTFTEAGYDALGDMQYFTEGGTDRGFIGDVATVLTVHPSENWSNDYYNVNDPVVRCYAIFDKVYVDVRTGGYIAQLMWEAERDSSAVSVPHIDLVIGNDDGCVPLTDILNEWSVLIGNEAAPPYTNVTIRREFAKEVSLI